MNSYYGDLGHQYPSKSDSLIVGLCTGQLASAAVSSSKTVGELIPAGVETVVLALRLGVCVVKVRELVEENRPSQSWSVLVSGMRQEEAKKIIGNFGRANVSNYQIKRKEIELPTLTFLSGFASRFTAIYQCCEPQWPDYQWNTQCSGAVCRNFTLKGVEASESSSSRSLPRHAPL